MNTLYIKVPNKEIYYNLKCGNIDTTYSHAQVTEENYENYFKGTTSKLNKISKIQTKEQDIVNKMNQLRKELRQLADERLELTNEVQQKVALNAQNFEKLATVTPEVKFSINTLIGNFLSKEFNKETENYANIVLKSERWPKGGDFEGAIQEEYDRSLYIEEFFEKLYVKKHFSKEFNKLEKIANILNKKFKEEIKFIPNISIFLQDKSAEVIATIKVEVPQNNKISIANKKKIEKLQK